MTGKKKLIFNPRVHNTWSQDANKFGQKMLERMGWKSGQGLGKNEDGIVDSVSATYKSDNQGLGFKEITEGSIQQDNFNLFLQSLNKNLESDGNNTTDNDIQLNSLEKKSERSRVRVHYRKVTRGKDISQYSEKDLANIFCRKNLKDVNEKMKERMDAEINGGSMDSYFKNKMKTKKQSKHSGISNDTNLESNCDEIATNGSKNEVLKPSFVSYLDESANGNIKNKKRKKFKACSDDSVSSPFKKFRIGEKEESGVGIINSAFEPFDNNVTVKEEPLDIIDENYQEVGTTLCNNTMIKEEEEPQSPNEVSIKVEENLYEFKKNKKKRLSGDSLSFKKSRTDEREDSGVGIVNPAFEPLGNNVTIKKEPLDTIDESDQELNTALNNNNSVIKVNSQSPEVEENLYELKIKKKKIKKKQLSGDQVNGLSLVSDAKNNKQMGIDNPLLNLDDSVANVSTDKSQDFEVKRKKHKKASKLGVDNVALNLSNANLSLQSIENNKNSVNGIENCGFSDFALKGVLTPQGANKLKRRKSVRFSETNEEFLIPNRTAQQVDEGNELFEISQSVIENGLKDTKSLKGIVNNGFNIRSKETISVELKNDYKSGIDNQAYDKRNQKVEEAIQSLTDTIDQYQAEVENGINESKAKKRKRKSLENNRNVPQE